MDRKDLVISLIALAFVIPGVSGITVDGDISDWGVDLENGDWSQESTWIPSSLDTIRFIVEDNSDPRYFDASGNMLVSYNGVTLRNYRDVFPGVHIITTPSGTVVPYGEALLDLHGNGYANVVPPSGGEAYDIEALFMDMDSSNLYIAIVTSVDPSKYYRIEEQAPKIGDLGLFGTKYGIRLSSTGAHGISQFQMCSNPVWADAIDYPLEAPHGGSSAYMTSCGNPIVNLADTSRAIVAKMVKTDNGNSNWVYELAIPLEYIGNPEYMYLNNIRVSEACGNDFTTAVPEFPTAALPALLAVGGYMAMRIRNRD